jgi:transcription elongation factor GreA
MLASGDQLTYFTFPMPGKLVTPAGLKKYQDELNYLKNTKRRDIAERVRAAKEQGDLAENAEYAAAKEEQAHAEGRIEELESILKTVTVVEKETKGATIGIGSTIKVGVNGQVMDFEIVGANEADPSGGKISNESAVGQALLGKKKGDKVDVETPGGVVAYVVEDVR